MRRPAIDTAMPTTAPPAAQTKAARWAPLAVLMSGTFMIVLDFFIVNVALPSMHADLHASDGAIEWVVAGYGLTFAAALITAGRLGDQLGRRRMFWLGLLLFTAASALCGLAPDATLLVTARLAQGLAAGMLSPNVLSIVGVTYTGADRVRAISVYGMVMGLAAAGGQLIGGALIQADPDGLGWRTVFLINVPVGAAALLLTRRLVPESRAANASRLDIPGAALVTAALLAILLPLVEGRQHGWPLWAWIALGTAPPLLALFAAHQLRLERRGRTPLLDPALFRVRSFSAGLLTQLALWAGQASFFLVLALYLQQGHGLTPLQAGLVFTVLAAAYLAASLRAPALTPRYGRRLIAAGALTLATGHALLVAALALAGPRLDLALLGPGLLLVGAGMGLCITPLTTTVLTSADPQRAGAVSGALSTMQQVGNALGVAVSGLIFFGAAGASGIGTAFELTLVQLALLLIVVAALTRLLPAPRPRVAS